MRTAAQGVGTVAVAVGTAAVGAVTSAVLMSGALVVDLLAEVDLGAAGTARATAAVIVGVTAGVMEDGAVAMVAGVGVGVGAALESVCTLQEPIRDFVCEA